MRCFEVLNLSFNLYIDVTMCSLDEELPSQLGFRGCLTSRNVSMIL
jgi:hypothetical protein